MFTASPQFERAHTQPLSKTLLFNNFPSKVSSTSIHGCNMPLATHLFIVVASSVRCAKLLATGSLRLNSAGSAIQCWCLKRLGYLLLLFSLGCCLCCQMKIALVFSVDKISGGDVTHVAGILSIFKLEGIGLWKEKWCIYVTH